MNKLYLLRAATFALFVATSAAAFAQLPVSREPHHKVIQENHYYRLLEGKIPMNDTTPAHTHTANSVVIFLSHSTFGIRVAGEKPVITTVNPGDVKYAPYGDKPVNHIVWNQTRPLLHFYVVELKSLKPHPILRDTPTTRDTPIIRNLTGPVHLEPTQHARLLVAITGGYHFYPPGTPIDLKSTGRRILLEFP